MAFMTTSITKMPPSSGSGSDDSGLGRIVGQNNDLVDIDNDGGMDNVARRDPPAERIPYRVHPKFGVVDI